MVFSSSVFLFIFLPLILFLYYNPLVKGRKFKNYVLLVGSVLFYAYGAKTFVFVILVSIVVNWYAGLKIEKSKKDRKLWITMAITWDVLLIGIFKYLQFITENIAWITNDKNVIIEIALPIGISFLSFQMMSYIFDIAYGKAKAQKSLSAVTLYILMFPQCVAGPIVRYETVQHEINNRT